MKKILIILFLFYINLYANIGKVSSVVGKVTIQRDSQVLVANIGSVVEKQDIVATESNAKTQILFNDNTIITIGKSSAFSIKEYFYENDQTQNSEASFDFFKGSFRAVTGKIGKLNPDKFKLKTKSAAIGIRGTVVFGDQSKIIFTEGRGYISSQGITRNIDSGFMVRTEPNLPPSIPEPTSAEVLFEFEEQSGIDTQNTTTKSITAQNSNFQQQADEPTQLNEEILNDQELEALDEDIASEIPAFEDQIKKTNDLVADVEENKDSNIPVVSDNEEPTPPTDDNTNNLVLSDIVLNNLISDESSDTATISGTAEPLSNISLTLIDSNAEEKTVSTIVNSDGSFSITLNTDGLADGSYTLSATATDGVSSVTRSLTGSNLDTFFDGVSIESIATGQNNFATISGTAEPLATINITLKDSAGGTKTTTVTAQADGTYSSNIDISGMNAVEFTASVTSSDSVNSISDSKSVTLDYSATLTGKHLGGYLWSDSSTSSNKNSFTQSGTSSLSISNGEFTLNDSLTQEFFNKGSGEVQVNSEIESGQMEPSITALSDGGWVVVWTSEDTSGSGITDTDGFHIAMQRYDSSGNMIGSEIQVNSEIEMFQEQPTVTALSDGGWIVTWKSNDPLGSGISDMDDHISMQRYDSSGNLVGGEIQVNSEIEGMQEYSSVTALNDGGWLVVWTSSDISGGGITDNDSSHIAMQRYDSSGNIIGSEIQVNSEIESLQYTPSVTSLSDGGWIVVWVSLDQSGIGITDTDFYHIAMQRYDSSGNPIGTEIQVNSEIESFQAGATATALNNGGWVVSWDSADTSGTNITDNSSTHVALQIYDSNGNPVGSEIQVNSYIDSDQDGSFVSILDDNKFIVTWSSGVQDGDFRGIYGQILNNDGTKVGNEFLINTTVLGSQYQPVITSLSDDRFIVAWQGEGSGDIDGIYTQIFYLNEEDQVVSGSMNFTSFDIPLFGNYSTHTNIGTLPFSQTLSDGTTISGEYQLEADNSAEFVVGYYDGTASTSGSVTSTFKDLWYAGTTPTMSNIDTSKIYKYSEFKYLDTIKNNGDFLTSTTLNDGDTDIYYNPVTSSIAFLDNEFYKYGALFSSGKVEMDGTFNSLNYQVKHGVQSEVQRILVSGDITGTSATESLSVLGHTLILDNSAGVYDTREAILAEIGVKATDIIATWNANNPDKEIASITTAISSPYITITYANTQSDVVEIVSSSDNGVSFNASTEIIKGNTLPNTIGNLNILGSLYGTNLQGIGYTGNFTEYKNYALSTQDMTESSSMIGAGFLDSPSISRSTGTVSMDGHVNTIEHDNLNNIMTTPYDLTLTMNRDDGTISGTMGGPGVTISGNVASGTSYYVTDDLFGSKISSMDNGGVSTLITDTGFVVAVPDNIDSNDNFEMLEDESSWGYWTAGLADNVDPSIQTHIDPQSTWVAGTKTSSTAVQELIDGSPTTHSFSGHVLGAVTNGVTVDPIAFDSNNYANFQFDFGGGSGNFQGSMGFNTVGGTSWNANIGSSTATSTGFSSTNISGTGDGASITSGNVDGSYYGTGSIKSIGGRFEFGNGSSTASGVFKATKQ